MINIISIRYCKGGHKIGIYALKDVEIGEEILFDYGSQFKVPWLLEFNEKMKKRQKEKFRRKKEKKNEKEVELFEGNFAEDNYDFIL